MHKVIIVHDCYKNNCALCCLGITLTNYNCRRTVLNFSVFNHCFYRVMMVSKQRNTPNNTSLLLWKQFNVPYIGSYLLFTHVLGNAKLLARHWELPACVYYIALDKWLVVHMYLWYVHSEPNPTNRERTWVTANCYLVHRWARNYRQYSCIWASCMCHLWFLEHIHMHLHLRECFHMRVLFHMRVP